jgi:hypothetical protein
MSDQKQDEKSNVENQLQAHLDKMNAEIAELKAKADKAEASAKLEYHKQLEELGEMRDRAQTKLAEMREASGEAWSDLKVGAENAWRSLRSAVDSATSRIRDGK